MLLAFLDFVSDLVYVTYTENWVSESLEIIVQALFIMNVLVNLTALLTAIHKLRKLVALRYDKSKNQNKNKNKKNKSKNKGKNENTNEKEKEIERETARETVKERETPGGPGKLDLLRMVMGVGTYTSNKNDDPRKHKQYPYVYEIKLRLNEQCGGSVGTILYPFVWIGYMILLCFISIFLGLTKLISIQQVQEWWMSWVVVDYQSKIESQKKTEKFLQTIKEKRDFWKNMDKPKAKKMLGGNEKNGMLEKNLAVVDENGKWLGYQVVEDSLLWKIYLWIDMKTPDWILKYKVNADLYNTYFISELIVESLPQLMMYVFYLLCLKMLFEFVALLCFVFLIKQ